MSLIKKCLVCLGCVVLLVIILIAAAPALLSTTYGKNASLRILASYYDGKVDVNSLSLGWFSGAKIDGLHVQDPQGKPLLECAKIDLDKPLIKWLYSWQNFGTVHIVSPTLYLTQSEMNQFEEHVKKKHSKETLPQKEQTAFVLPGIQGNIAVENAKIVATRSGQAPAVVSDGAVTIQLDLKDTSTGTIQANISKGATPPTPLSVSFTMTGNPLSTGSASFSLQLADVPTELVAGVAESVDQQYGPVVRDSLGSSFSYNVDGSVTQGKVIVSSHLKSENFCSDIDASLDKDELSVQQGSLLKGTITPALCKAVAAICNQKSIALVENAPISLDNTSPFTIDTKNLDFIKPCHLKFTTQSSVLLQIDQETLALSCSADISGSQESKNVKVLLTSADPQQATVRFDIAAVPKSKGYDLNSSVVIAGLWPKIVSKFLEKPLPTDLKSPISAEVKAQGEVVDSSNFSIHGSFACTLSEIQGAATTFDITKAADSPLILVQTDGAVNFNPADQALCVLLGNSIKFGMQATLDPKDEKYTLAKMSIASSALSAEINDLSYGKNTLTLSAPAKFSYKQEHQILPQFKQGFCQVEVLPFSFSIQNSQMIGKPIEVTSSEQISLADYKEPFLLTVPASIDLEHRKIKLNILATQADKELIKGAIIADVAEKTPLITGDLSMKESPVSLMDTLSKQKLSELIGQKVSAGISFVFTGLNEEGNNFTLHSQGDFWKLDADMHLDDGILSAGKSGLNLETTLSPEYIKALQAYLQKKTDLEFLKPVTVRAAVSSLQCNILPFLEKKEMQLGSLISTLKVKANVSISASEVLRAGKEVASISSLSGNLDIDGEKQHVEFHLTPVQSDKAVSPEASVSIQDFFDTNTPSLKNATVDAKFKINYLPLRLADLVVPGKAGLAEELVGKRCCIDGKVSIKKMQTGFIQADVKADHASVHFDGSIKNGNLTLNSPAFASLELTKAAGEVLLKGVNPLFASGAHSEKPITISVDPKDVSIPLSTFSFNNLTVPKVTIDVGKMVVKNGGALKVILALLKMGKAANSDELNVWLTPIYLQVNHGLVNCLRSDALVADDLHMITWGTADLVRDNLDMIIAIPMESLSKLGIQVASTHPERGLQIPIKGPSSNPKIETARATAKLAGAGATKVSSDKRVQLLGGLIQAAATVGEEDKPIPAPTTQPLPWERGR